MIVDQDYLEQLVRDIVIPEILEGLAERPRWRERGAVGSLTFTAALVEGQLRQGTIDVVGPGPDAPENMAIMRCVVEQLWAEARRLRAADGG